MTHRTAYVTKTKIPWTCFSEEQLQRWLYCALLNDLSVPTFRRWRNEQKPYPTPTTVTIPYIKGTSETISRILQPYNIRVAHKPTITLRYLLTNFKDRNEPNKREGAVYKMKCSDCQTSYIDETGRNLNTRLTEHKRTTGNGDANNHIALHHQLTNYNIDWDNAQCLTYRTNYFQRLTLESWYTNLEQTPLNRCQTLANDLSTTSTKPTNGLLTDRINLTNNTRTLNRLP